MVVPIDYEGHCSWDCQQMPHLPETHPYPSASAPILSEGLSLAVMATRGLRRAWKPKDLVEGLERRQVGGGNE